MNRQFLNAKTLVLLTLFAIPVSALGEDAGICTEPVATAQGLIRGYADADHAACGWRGIPYAAAPVGDLRLKPPEPPPLQTGVLDALAVGPGCPQDATLTSGGELAKFDEDCLFLNVYRPQKSGRFPVMFWIHGGAFRQGSGGYPMYDGARLAAEREVVLVTINYRIGALGFMALSELAAENPHGATGNYGLLDQIQALRWVKENIAGFGGDPGNVTIFGQSAGGMSACALLASPLAAGLFHRAVPMSGSCDMVEGLPRGFEQGKRMAEAVGCAGPDALACLRAKPFAEFVFAGKNTVFNALNEGISYSLHLDGYALAEQPLAAIRAGRYNRVPVMIGHTRDEIQMFTMLVPGMSLWPKALVNKLLDKLLGPEADAVRGLYSYQDYKRPVRLLLAVCNEAFGSRGFAAAEALAPTTPVYFYRFDWDQTRFENKMGAFHGLDVPFVFGAFNLESKLARILANRKVVDAGEPLSLQMMAYYTNFAKTGDPNGEGLPAWPRYDAKTRTRLYFDTPITVAPLSEKEIARCRYFDQFTIEGMKLQKKE